MQSSLDSKYVVRVYAASLGYLGGKFQFLYRGGFLTKLYLRCRTFRLLISAS